MKLGERALTQAAKAGWVVFNKLNSISPNASFTPKWSDKPLLKSYQKEKPPLGWPRTTDSLCPKCIPEIRQQIVSMQTVTTSAVTAIRSISSTIGEINDVTTAIAAAVEEQGAATREIARNIQHAAGGTSEVSSNIVGVSSASTEAGTAAGEVLTASGALRREADVLRAEIDAFLENIRAA